VRLFTELFCAARPVSPRDRLGGNHDGGSGAQHGGWQRGPAGRSTRGNSAGRPMARKQMFIAAMRAQGYHVVEVRRDHWK